MPSTCDTGLVAHVSQVGARLAAIIAARTITCRKGARKHSTDYVWSLSCHLVKASNLVSPRPQQCPPFLASNIAHQTMILTAVQSRWDDNTHTHQDYDPTVRCLQVVACVPMICTLQRVFLWPQECFSTSDHNIQKCAPHPSHTELSGESRTTLLYLGQISLLQSLSAMLRALCAAFCELQSVIPLVSP